jgi:OOP family OmpA-OmpF porin
MKKTASVILAAVSLSACDARSPTPAPTPSPTPTSVANSSVAAQSIMQPKVIAETQPAPAATPVAPLPTGGTILFERGASLDDAGREALDTLLATPSLPSDARWILRGSSDNDGSSAANLRVSRLRAEAVRDYLVEQGVDETLITVVALGDGRPAAPNVKLDGSDDVEGRRKNRRVDIEIDLPQPEAPSATKQPSLEEPPVNTQN